MRLTSIQVEGVSGELANTWPFTIPSVRQIMDGGLDFRSSVIFLVGENGAGKSTILEAIAEAYAIDVRGGHGGRRYSSPLPKGILGSHLRLIFEGKPRHAGGFFLRAETASGVFKFMSDYGVPGYGNRHLEEVSHGEGLLQVMDGGRFRGSDLFLFDEPETPLSFSSCLKLLRHMQDMQNSGAQIICATHSPMLTALPGAQILKLDSKGIVEILWQELQIVHQWRRFLADPASFLEARRK